MPENTISKGEYQKAFNTAVRLLARRDHTSLEILQKLNQRGFSIEIIDTVLSECKRLNYIDDERTARVYIGQLARKGFGLRRIRMELKKKGLSGDRFEALLKVNASEIDEQKIAQRILQKKIKSLKKEDDDKKRSAKVYRFLYSRGFSKSVISEVVRKLG